MAFNPLVTSDDWMVREVTFMVRMFNYHKRVRADMLGVTGNGVVGKGS